MKIVQFACLVLLSSISLCPLAAVAQGSLTPPGAPAPTMLSLSQVEPRTPVDSAHTPGNSIYEFIITQPGSYYLTTNVIGVSSEEGIGISANNVTLDLNGFSLIGPLTADSGIIISSIASNSIVKNGTISGWGALYDGVQSLGNNASLENLNVSAGVIGIACTGDGSVIKNCTISHAGQWGVYLTGSNSLVSCNYFIENNIGNNGNGAALFINSANNVVQDNRITGSSPSGSGILVNGIAGITNNVIIRNTVMGSKPANNYSVPTILNDVGPIGNASTNTSPWGNISN
jgi:Right handed beta helix region